MLAMRMRIISSFVFCNIFALLFVLSQKASLGAIHCSASFSNLYDSWARTVAKAAVD
jgi:hypothetical protein